MQLYVTGSVKRDLNLLFKMRVLQRSVFPQRYAQSKSNTGVLRRRRQFENRQKLKIPGKCELRSLFSDPVTYSCG